MGRADHRQRAAHGGADQHGRLAAYGRLGPDQVAKPIVIVGWRPASAAEGKRRAGLFGDLRDDDAKAALGQELGERAQVRGVPPKPCRRIADGNELVSPLLAGRIWVDRSQGSFLEDAAYS